VALVAGMDKKKAARQAASVASAIANGNSAPHTRAVARVVAHTLTAIGNRQDDEATAVTPAPGLGSEAGPAAEPTAAPVAGWEQAVRAVQKLRQARSSAQTAARENVAVAPGSTVKSGGRVTDDGQQAVQPMAQGSPGSGPVSAGNSPGDAKAVTGSWRRGVPAKLGP